MYSPKTLSELETTPLLLQPSARASHRVLLQNTSFLARFWRHRHLDLVVSEATELLLPWKNQTTQNRQRPLGFDGMFHYAYVQTEA